MKTEDRKAFLDIVIGLCELKGKQFSAQGLELYWASMQSWSIEDFRAAANELVRKCEFMPTPKDFEDIRKAARATSGEAWVQAIETAREWRELRPHVSSGNAFIDQVVRAVGGYRAIAMTDTDKLHFLERRFAEHFESMQDVGDVREALPNLMRDAIGPSADGPRRLGHSP